MWGGRIMTRIDRRKLLKYSGAATIATGTGGIAGILASVRAPAYAQATSIHWLRWSDFVPPSDQLLKSKIVPQGEKALGIKLNLEMINANDIQARITAAIQSGSGPDIFYVIGNWPQLYVESLSDVSDITAEIGEVQGGYYDISKAVATVGQKWIGVPWTTGGGLLTYRKSWFAEIGYSDGKFPPTWDEYRAAGKKLKAKGRPFGQTLGHTLGMPRASGIPISGRGAAKKSKPTARRWRSTARRRSSRSSLPSAFGRTHTTKAALLGTIRATIAPTWQAPSAAPTTAPRSISRPRKNPTHT